MAVLMSQLDGFLSQADFLPVDFWPDCVEYGLETRRRRLKVAVKCQHRRLVRAMEVTMVVSLPFGGDVSLWIPVKDESLSFEEARDKLMAEAKDLLQGALIDHVCPEAHGSLIVWKEMRR